MDKGSIFTKSEFQKREIKLKEELKNIDISIIFNRPDLYYYSGTGLDGMLIVNIVKDEMTRFVYRNADLAKTQSFIHVEEMGSFRIFKEISKDCNARSLGLELDILPYKTVQYIKKAFNNIELHDISLILREIRSVKSKAEQEIMKQAAKQTDKSFELARDIIEPGMSEIELSSKIEKFLRNNGHPGFLQIRAFSHNMTTNAVVMSGSNTSTLNTRFGPVSGVGISKIHQNGPSNRKFKENDVVLIDTTGSIEGYIADETRTFFLGVPDMKMIDAYDVALQVHDRTEKILIAGNKPSNIYKELSELVDELGLGNNFMGIKDDKVAFIGHGIGLELDEYPIITPGYTNELKEGQIVAIEPKFIFKNTGVGIEDDYIVGTNSAERITFFER
jgi:Xaa-Pro aminopeptidase